ncbi:MAG: DUF2007 domain-containing protein [Pseudomonadota bacterium]
MREIVKSNDPVLVNFVEVLLRDAGCRVVVADQNMSIVEGSIGVFPKRVLVDDEKLSLARSVLRQADLGQWIVDDQ